MSASLSDRFSLASWSTSSRVGNAPPPGPPAFSSALEDTASSGSAANKMIQRCFLRAVPVYIVCARNQSSALGFGLKKKTQYAAVEALTHHNDEDGDGDGNGNGN